MQGGQSLSGLKPLGHVRFLVSASSPGIFSGVE